MSFLSRVKDRTKVLVFPAIFLSITVYFGWNAKQGDRGLVAHAERLQLLKQVQDDLAAAKVEREAWMTRVRGLRDAQLDPDTLDERVRTILNLADPNEVIVKYNNQEKLF